jgi:antirestriction protein
VSEDIKLEGNVFSLLRVGDEVGTPDGDAVVYEIAIHGGDYGERMELEPPAVFVKMKDEAAVPPIRQVCVCVLTLPNTVHEKLLSKELDRLWPPVDDDIPEEAHMLVDPNKEESAMRSIRTSSKRRKADLDEPIKLYIADLAAYNAGKLVGQWVELPVDEEELDEIIDRLTHGGTQDYAIHDYEAPFKIGEYDSPYKLNELAEKLEDTHVPLDIIVCALDSLGIPSDDWDSAIQAAEDASVYHAKDETDLAYEVIDQLGIEGADPEGYHFDYEAFGRDLRIERYGYDEETEEDMYEGMSDEDVGYDYVDSVGGVSALGKRIVEMYFDYASYGRDFAMDFHQCGEYFVLFH